MCQVDELFRRFCAHPVFVIIDVRPGVEGIPVTAYRSKEEVEQVQKLTIRIMYVNMGKLLRAI